MDSESLNMITCIVQRGEADKVVDAALEAGAEGATIYYARGRGVREKLGIAKWLIKPEKEVIIIVTRPEETNAVFDAIIKVGHLNRKGMGFAFLHKVDRAIGFIS
ncbi:MAG: P-II family nitrogen regulator [Thermodesulfobacteriota bacterium]